MFWLPFYNRKRQCGDVISNSRIELQFDVEKPIDLVDLTLAFAAFSRQYKKFVTTYLQEKNIEIENDDSVRLFVTKIESNCITAEMGWFDPNALFGAAYVMMDNANTVREFIKNLSFYYDAFRGVISIGEEKQLGKRDTEDYRDLLQTVVDGGGSLRCQEINYDKNGVRSSNFKMEYVSDDAVRAMRGIESRISILEKTSAADYEKVLMSLDSVQEKIQKAESKRTRDYGIIERISSKPLPVYWLSDLDQKRVKSFDGNLFQCSLIVDANVEAKHGETKAYRILKLHDIIPD